MAPRAPRTLIFDVLGFAVVLAMVVSLVLLVREHEVGFGELALEISQEDLEAGFREGYEYHAIYSGSTKIGTLRTERRRNGDGYRLRSEMDLHVELGVVRQKTHTVVDAFLDPDFRLERFRATTEGGFLTLALEGQWNGTAMVVTGLPGESGAREFALPEAPFILHSLRPVLMRKRLERGDRVTFSYYDPIGQQPIETDVTFLGEEELELMGTTVEAFRFRQTALGQQSEVWVNALGEVLVEELPMGFRAVREPEAEARYGLRDGPVSGGESPSVASDSSLPIAGVLGEPVLGRGRWTSARFELADLGALQAGLAGERQRMVPGGTGGKVSIAVSAEASLPALLLIESVDLEGMASDLGESLTLTTQDAVLRSTARDVLATVTPANGTRLRLDEKVAALAPWVARTIVLSDDDEGAMETAASVLSEGRGSVQGRAMLLAAMLRAEGVPSRLAWGIVALGGDAAGELRLVAHSWVEVYLGRWVAVDPTLGMVPADAGYLRLGYGERLDGGLTRSAVGALRVVRVSGE